MSAVIRVHGLADGFEFPSGTYLHAFDVEHQGRQSMEFEGDDKIVLYGSFGGRFVLTRKLVDAHRFDDVADAMRAWNTVSKSNPIRPTDGRPNKPLTAFSVEVETV